MHKLTSLRAVAVIFIVSFFMLPTTILAKMLFPIDLIDKKGTSSDQPLSVLAKNDQAYSHDSWDRYVEFTPASNGYRGIIVFDAGNLTASKLDSLTLYINYRGPKNRYQQWVLDIYDVTETKWRRFLDNSQTDWWRWKILIQSIYEAPNHFIDGNGKIRIRYSTQSRADSSQLDYVALKLVEADSTANRSQPNSSDPSPSDTPEQAEKWWKPSPGLNWQIQYAGQINTTIDVEAFNLDLFDTSKPVINELHSQGKKVICYFSAGSYEDWRPDNKRFSKDVKGSSLDGWPGEQWLDIRRLDILLPMMNDRLDLAAEKGCDAVDPDNVDGYSNRTGFPLNYQDQINYNSVLASAAHERGLAIGLKNNLDQVQDLASFFDFATNEECFQYNECEMLRPFVQSGKPVLGIEYGLSAPDFCPQANSMNFDFLKKSMELDSWRISCR